MAVQHGYGKIAGADALVFAYDTGDTRNSYRGEPTVNLSYNNGQGGSEYLAAPITWVNAGSWDYNGNATDVPKPEVIGVNTAGLRVISGTNTTAGGSVHFGCGFTPVSPSTTYTVSVWYRQNRAGASQPYLRTSITNVGLANLAYNGDTNSANWPVNQWIRLSATGTTASNENGIYISNYIGTYVGDKIWYFAHQVEQKSHVTPLVTGTRSATEGLLDLTGNSSISLNSSTFNSNGQIDLDGTSTSIYPGTISAASGLSEVTFETVVRSNANNKNILLTAGNPILLHYGGAGFYLVSSDGTASGYLGWNSELAGGTGVYEHLAATWDGSTMKLYVNGQKITYDRSFSGGTSGVLKPFNNTTLGGYFNSTQPNFNGNIDVAKIYNRALTASEIQANFNHYKTRFNIA